MSSELAGATPVPVPVEDVPAVGSHPASIRNALQINTPNMAPFRIFFMLLSLGKPDLIPCARSIKAGLNTRWLIKVGFCILLKVLVAQVRDFESRHEGQERNDSGRAKVSPV